MERATGDGVDIVFIDGRNVVDVFLFGLVERVVVYWY